MEGVKYWETIADNLKKADWSWGFVSAIDANGRTIWIADAHFPEIWIVIGAIRIVERLIEQLFCGRRQIYDFQPPLQFIARVILEQ